MPQPPAISVETVSKKYCKSLKRSMIYGMLDIGRNMWGMSSKPGQLRKNEFWALRDISVEVQKGETLGVIGPNGSGKTTLLKILNGIFWPDRGVVRLRGQVGALIEVGAGFHPLLTGRENIFVNAAVMGLKKKEVERRFDAIVDFAAIGEFLDVPVKHYSSGMFVRLGFAVAVHCRPDILLVDEVLAVGDEGFQRKCFDKVGELKRDGTTPIIVSHNMHLVSAFSDRVLLLEQGQAKYFEDPEKGIHHYNQLFLQPGDTGIEKICNGTDSIRFLRVETTPRKLNPGDSFTFHLTYEANRDFPDVNIDAAIWSGGEARLYFQATNEAFHRRIDLKKGEHTLEIAIGGIPLCQSLAKIILAVWSRKREELLFWWRVPVEFQGKEHSGGRNFLEVAFRTGD